MLIKVFSVAFTLAFYSSQFAISEPGYYEDGKFGIRLENVLIVKEADTKFNFGDKGYLTFEHRLREKQLSSTVLILFHGLELYRNCRFWLSWYTHIFIEMMTLHLDI